jgi:cytochrome c2
VKLIGAAMILAVAGCEANSAKPQAIKLSLGERAYQKCYACHALEPGRSEFGGPSLHQIVGKPVAAEPGFGYSAALRGFAAVEPRWTRELLDRFIADPEALVPGTSMTFHGIADADERSALIAYLEAQTSASATSLP